MCIVNMVSFICVFYHTLKKLNVYLALFSSVWAIDYIGFVMLCGFQNTRMIGKLYRETIVSSMALIFGMAKPRYTAIVEGRTGLVRRCLKDGEKGQRFIFFHVTHTTKSLGWTYFLGAVVLHTKQSAMQLSCCLLLGRKRNHIILYHLWPQAGAGCGC